MLFVQRVENVDAGARNLTMATHLAPWVIWIAIGSLLVIAELVVPSFFIIWFGMAGIVVGLLLLMVDMPLPVQIILWIILSLVFFAAFRRRFSPKQGVVPVGTSTGDALGRVGILKQAVGPNERGIVRFTQPVIGADEWLCVADRPIPAGARVRVTAVIGQFVRVEPVE